MNSPKLLLAVAALGFALCCSACASDKKEDVEALKKRVQELEEKDKGKHAQASRPSDDRGLRSSSESSGTGWVDDEESRRRLEGDIREENQERDKRELEDRMSKSIEEINNTKFGPIP